MSRYPFGYTPYRAKTTVDWARTGRFLGGVAAALAFTTLILVLIAFAFQSIPVVIAACVIGAVAFVAGAGSAMARRRAARQAGEES